MKRSLIAMAILAATGTAMAQSSVNMYGTADVAVGKLRFGKTGMQSNTAVNSHDSYLGFRGVEDLGSGLKTGFIFEQNININSGASDTHTFQRSANLWIGDTWGTVRAGSAYTPSYTAMSAWNLMGRNNNSIAGQTFGAVGGETNYYQNSQLSYKTPNINGLTIEAAYVFKADNKNHSKYDLGFVYASGPLTAGLAYNKTQSLDANYAFGGQYNFGTFDVAMSYFHSRNGGWRDETTGQMIPNAVSMANGFTIGGKIKLGSYSLALDIARETSSSYTLNNSLYKMKNRTNFIAHGLYALSKRTFIYTNILRINDDHLYGIGMRHDF